MDHKKINQYDLVTEIKKLESVNFYIVETQNGYAVTRKTVDQFGWVEKEKILSVNLEDGLKMANLMLYIYIMGVVGLELYVNK